ncbi:hypothetical protein Emin_0143 [Elusimicrobium minutum Pei191]|uniref:Uncharacterized protein n=1 Tax=Elusimicrobium minutum (strain Pei191) TaxID=445932 RepID=B2KBM2_ELUMP|nr:hypothetical protein Emin_0143 [Elusimicrobium minutum Pei191]
MLWIWDIDKGNKPDIFFRGYAYNTWYFYISSQDKNLMTVPDGVQCF